jgi:hypothetical protein
MNIFLPVASAALLLRVRRNSSLGIYALWCAPFFAAAVVTWLFAPQIVYYSKGPLNAVGFDSWAVPAAAFCIAAICSLATERRYVRVFQIVAAFLVTDALFLFFAGWIA